MNKILTLLFAVHCFTASSLSDVVGSVTALYSFVSDPGTQTQTLIDRLAVALNRGYDAGTNAGLFSVRSIFEIDGAVACSSTTNVLVPTSLGSGLGCQRVTFDVSQSANLTEYELRYRVQFWDFYFARRASDVALQFTVSIPPNSPSAANYTWLSSSTESSSNWVQRLYPQDAWVAQSTLCSSGKTCETLTVAPSMRYMHSSILYTSWNFTRDVLPHATLCNLGVDNSDCTAACLTDMTLCSGATTMDDYFSRVATTSFWSSSYFTTDDGYADPVADTHQSTCPTACCGNRRQCMRENDDLGRHVPFDQTYLLQFGGRTRQKLEVDGEDLYLHCESILAGLNITENQSLSSCYEIQSNELWRYDLTGDTWELMKPRTLSTTFPAGRYAHGAALAVIPAENDLANTRRQYMYVFGGLSTDCTNGLCVDLWRYEIPWAAQAYWPTAGSATPASWVPGNAWKQLRDCPYGGRHRHTMEATSTALYVFGGQQQGEWDDRLLIYRVAADTWDVVLAEGYRYFTQSAVDYLGAVRAVNLTDFIDYDDVRDVLGETGILGSSGVHPPLFPEARGDHSGWTTDNSLWIANGFGTNYTNNIWQYDIASNIWLEIFSRKNATNLPSARRGTSVSVREDLILMFGGVNGDELFKDMWVLNISAPRSERVWQQLADAPAGVAYHTMNYDSSSDSYILFGGLNWTQANLTLSDILVDRDRTCFSTARSLLKTECASNSTNITCALAQAVTTLDTACASDSSSFCCDSTYSNATSLGVLSDTCTSECQAESFASELTIGFGEGIWIYTPFSNCSSNCSNHGECYLGKCKCEDGWIGEDCSWQTCPGSVCYFDFDTLDSVCAYCSNNGVCTLGATKCACNDGWTGTDCSQVDCLNCAGTCLPDFPVHQCICDPGFSGPDCQTQLCLNGCSLAGECDEGACVCDENFFGPDCSVYIMTAGYEGPVLSLALLLLLAV